MLTFRTGDATISVDTICPCDHTTGFPTAGSAAAQRILQTMLSDPTATITHDTTGAPAVCGHPDLHISVSHSRTHAAVALSASPLGIDLEEPREALGRVAPKFLQPEERRQFVTTEQLLRAWTAKEAVYKALRGKFKLLSTITLHPDFTAANAGHDRFTLTYFTPQPNLCLCVAQYPMPNANNPASGHPERDCSINVERE